jgi:hypothetical protein
MKTKQRGRPMKKQQIKDFGFIIEKAIKRLPDGESRFFISRSPIGHACLNGLYGPNLGEHLSSDYGMPSEEAEIEEDFNTEILTLMDLMKEADVPIDLADWQSASISDAEEEKMFKSEERRNYAIQLWQWFGIPWRYKNGFIYLIWPPTDPFFGTPIIHGYTVKDFLVALVNKQEEHFVYLAKLDRKHKFWSTFGQITIILLGLISILLISLVLYSLRG